MANGTGGTVVWRSVTPEYFRTLDISILQGRGFSDEDMSSGEHFVVLSRALATRMFPGQDSVGQHLLLGGGAPNPGGPENPWYTVVGVAADVKNGGLTGGDEPEYYRLRRSTAQDWSRASVILMKANLPADMIENWARAQIEALDPAVPVQFETLLERVNKMADQPRFETLLVGFFASTGLGLSVMGLYGVISFLVAQRTQEIGIRLAVGATRADILKLVMVSGLRLTISGTLLGLLLALAVSRTLSSLLFNVGPQDPVAFGCVTFLLVLVAAVATLIPAASATAVRPTVALRCD